ncbi:MAG: glycosyltransferase family 2 protein [archaeon]|nr:glycosyltransferase family 2 protein [Nanoarchaeota archaeon]
MSIFYLFLAIMIFVSLIAYYNFLTAPRLKKRTLNVNKEELPFISILIPARNEEDGISKCLASIIHQNYPNYEVIVCDDNSDDKTADIIKKYMRRSDKLKMISGKPLPDDWTGKNWACQQLGLEAKGDQFLFLDADVTLRPETLTSALALMQKKDVQMLSCFPRQKLGGLGEWLVVPLIDWLTLSFIPFDLVYRLKTTHFSVAIGQFILIKKETYLEMGRHKAIRKIVVEDMEMAKKVKELGHKILPCKSTGLVECRMYSGLRESVNGMARSTYNGASIRPVIYVLYLLGLFTLFVVPFILAFFNIIYIFVYVPLIFQRALSSVLSRQNVIVNLILFPAHIIFFIIVAFYSLHITLGKKIVWKGRRIKF